MKWRDDIVKMADGNETLPTEATAGLGDVYVQQWTPYGSYDNNDDHNCLIPSIPARYLSIHVSPAK